MTQAPAAIVKIPTESPQLAPGKAAKPPRRAKKAPGAVPSPVLASGNGRAATRGDGEVIELECGITVYLAQWVDPAEIPSDGDIAKLGEALAGSRAHGDRDELMGNTAAYSGLRWGELISWSAPGRPSRTASDS